MYHQHSCDSFENNGCSFYLLEVMTELDTTRELKSINVPFPIFSLLRIFQCFLLPLNPSGSVPAQLSSQDPITRKNQESKLHTAQHEHSFRVIEQTTSRRNQGCYQRPDQALTTLGRAESHCATMQQRPMIDWPVTQPVLVSNKSNDREADREMLFFGRGHVPSSMT